MRLPFGLGPQASLTSVAILGKSRKTATKREVDPKLFGQTPALTPYPIFRSGRNGVNPDRLQQLRRARMTYY